MGGIPSDARDAMPAIETQVISRDLANIVHRVECGSILGAEFCERLTRSLAQLFGVTADTCSDEDRMSFDRILVRIVPTASLDARIYLSDRLADADCPPRGTLLMLANDVIDVAREVLMRSPALGEDDLVGIARNRGPRHMGVIAVRPDLTLRITDVLVLRGDDEVRRVVAANGEAPISDKSFARLSLQARGDALIEARLVGRDDLPDLVVRFLLENGSPVAREALSRRAAHRSSGDLCYGAIPIRAAEAGWLEAYDFDAAATILDRIAEARSHADGFVRRLAQGDRFAEIVHVLASLTGLRLETMKHLLVSLDTEPFAVIARALGLKSETVLELLATGPWLHRLDGRNRDAATARYRALDPEEARGRLKRWVAKEAGR